MKIEICIASDNLDCLREQVLAAKSAGAATIELCSHMEFGGLTPSQQAIDIARQAFAGIDGLMVMIRPRPSNFNYLDAEVKLMSQSIEKAAQSGADGVVLGVLDREKRVNADALEQLVAVAQKYRMSVTFHRAFDALDKPHEAIGLLGAKGVRRILSAGSPWENGLGATAGITNLNAYLKQIDGRMELVVAGGVSTENMALLISELTTNTEQLSFHAYSSVLNDGVVDSHKVAQLCQMAGRTEHL